MSDFLKAFGLLLKTRRTWAIGCMALGTVLWMLGGQITDAEPILPWPFFVAGVVLFLIGMFSV
jgi:hypothetical protein